MIIKFVDYLKLSFLFFIGLAIFAALILSSAGDRTDIIGASIGLLISYGNTLLGFAIILWGYKRSLNEFMASFYGGMIFRFLLIFVVLFVLIVTLKIEVIALIISLCVSYFVFLGLEIYLMHKYSGSTED